MGAKRKRHHEKSVKFESNNILLMHMLKKISLKSMLKCTKFIEVNNWLKLRKIEHSLFVRLVCLLSVKA